MGLSVLGIALGVAVVVSIELANVSAQRAFELSAEGVTGRATHQIVGPGGGIDEDVYRRLRVDLGIDGAAPVLEGYATVPTAAPTFRVLGVDPLAEGPFRPYARPEAGVELSSFIAMPWTVLLSTSTAATLGRSPGDSLRIHVGGVERSLRVVGLIEPRDERTARALDNLLVVDVSTAQALLDMRGRLSRIDLVVPDGSTGDALLDRVREVLPAGVEVARSSARTETIEQMTRAFELNLKALSLLALIVGMFLIYNTMTFAVVQRRTMLGRLRALGATRGQVFRLVLGEAVVLGTIGTGIGLLLGIVLADALVHLVTRAINDLYYVVSVRELTVAPLTVLKGVGLGLGATLLAAVPPAREATRAPAGTVLQRSREESKVRALVPRLAVAGVVLGLAGLVLLWMPTRSVTVGYAALLCILLAFALATPLATAGLSRLLRPVMGRLFGVVGRMAARAIVATLSRTGVAIAALTVAIAATVGVGVMVDSFRSTVEVWLGYSLRADVYVQPPSAVFRRAMETLQPDVVRALRSTPGVEEHYTVRSVQISSERGPVELVAIDYGPNTRRTFRFKRGAAGEIWERFGRDDVVIVSEPYSYRHHVDLGDTVRLQTDRGRHPFAVRGVFYDYGSDLGVVMMSRTVYDTYFDDPAISGMALYAAPGASVDGLIERLRGRVEGRQEVFIRSNRALRQASLDIFDRTFTVTTVLRLLAVLVAFVGVLSALMALQLERVREVGVLRANGMTPGQVWQYVTIQTGGMGFIAGLLSLPLGLALASVLVYVINKRSFGWTLQFEVAPDVLLQAVGLALLAALLAGLYPAWTMANANPARALREG